MEDKQYTVLVVEDEKPLLKIIQHKLQTNNYHVLTSRSVKEALDILSETTHIDAIWLDHYLYGTEDGLGMVVELKAEGSRWRNIPVFVVSNTVGGDKARMYLRLGAERFYTKSNHRLEDIINDIKEHLDSVQSQSAV